MTTGTWPSREIVPAPATLPDFQMSYERNVREGARAAWAHMATILLTGVCCCAAVSFALKGTSYIAYMMLFAIMAPVSYIFKHVCFELRALDQEHCLAVLTICIQNKHQRHLMEGLRWQLAHTPGLENNSEVTIERQENPMGGASLEVELRPIRSIINVKLRKGTRCEQVRIEMDGGESQVGMPGRAALQMRSSGRLQFLFAAWLPQGASAKIAAAQDDARVFLHSWLQHVYTDYMKTSTGVVEVYELAKDHAEAPLAWNRVRKERSVSIGGKGTFTYCATDWAITLKNRAEYAIHHGGKTRVTLFVSGRKGSGKTLFVEWLAGELCLPLYSMDLASASLNNEVLREVITPNKLAHNLPVIFHFDEFQSMIKEWSDSRSSSRPRSQVTIQGLQSMLEGTSTPNNAIFVFTSSRSLPDLVEVGAVGSDEQHEWRGLLRRLPVQVCIPMMGSEQRKEYCQRFLSAYLSKPWDPNCPQERRRWSVFEKAWAQSHEGVPFDMLAKYAQERTQAAYIAGMMTSYSQGCKVKEECRDSYLEAFFSSAYVERWISEYAGNTSSSFRQAPSLE